MRLPGKVALISGGARGMGAAEARLFAREGAQVVVGDILEAEGKAVEADIAAKGGQAAFVRLDVTREADWREAVALAERRFGKLDVLVNNAGIGGAGRIEDTTLDAWQRVMSVNATWRVPGNEGRHRSHAPGRWWLDREHLVPARAGRHGRQQPAIHRVQGSNARYQLNDPRVPVRANART
jgi:NAD(P)-dependent dehydrogenase (short-subunit alcohol dehydrogenase family)